MVTPHPVPTAQRLLWITLETRGQTGTSGPTADPGDRLWQANVGPTTPQKPTGCSCGRPRPLVRVACVVTPATTRVARHHQLCGDRPVLCSPAASLLTPKPQALQPPAPTAYPDIEGGAPSPRAVLPAAILSAGALVLRQHRRQGRDLLVDWGKTRARLLYVQTELPPWSVLLCPRGQH